MTTKEKRIVGFAVKNTMKLLMRVEKLEKIISEMDSIKTFLTVNEVCREYSISRRTFDRYKNNGLKVYQPKRNGKIIVNREEFEEYLGNLKW